MIVSLAAAAGQGQREALPARGVKPLRRRQLHFCLSCIAAVCYRVSRAPMTFYASAARDAAAIESMRCAISGRHARCDCSAAVIYFIAILGR